MFFLCPPKISKILKLEHYQARRDVIGQQQKVHSIRLHLAQAEAALQVYEEREENLEAQLLKEDRLAHDSVPASPRNPLGIAAFGTD